MLLTVYAFLKANFPYMNKDYKQIVVLIQHLKKNAKYYIIMSLHIFLYNFFFGTLQPTQQLQ